MHRIDRVKKASSDRCISHFFWWRWGCCLSFPFPESLFSYLPLLWFGKKRREAFRCFSIERSISQICQRKRSRRAAGHDQRKFYILFRNSIPALKHLGDLQLVIHSRADVRLKVYMQQIWSLELLLLPKGRKPRENYILANFPWHFIYAILRISKEAPPCLRLKAASSLA